MSRPQKEITKKELEFAKLVGEYDFTPVEAARRAFGWRCEPDSAEAQKARDFATRTPRIKYVIDQLRANRKKKLEAQVNVQKLHQGDIRTLNQFLIHKLKEVRDNTNLNARVRYQAIQALEKLRDPSTDRNLIMKWIYAVWSFMEAHCPACHNSFPLADVKNRAIEEYATVNNLPMPVSQTNLLDRRMALLSRASIRRTPHPSQIRALEAPERHIVGTAAARAGKSYLLALFALMAFLIPGAETWIIAKTYENANKESEYLQQFFKTLFHPYDKDLVKVYEDKKEGELIMYSRWGSTIKIRSSKSRFSISGHELELAIVAEPGWVPDNIYNHLRARMVSRLGRILALGTPQDTGGFLGRMIRAVGRDAKGRIIRLKPEERLIENGCRWDKSMLIYKLRAEDNPEYVLSEQEAAREEMSDAEFATEFEGEAVAAEGSKFPNLKDIHVREVPSNFFQKANFVLGIDQGTANFAACLVAWDGNTIVPCYEYLDKSRMTMRANLANLMIQVPRWITLLGGNVNAWKHTIVDLDPQIMPIFEELRGDGRVWPTDISERYRNRRNFNDDWRKENTEYFNNMSLQDRIIFHLSSLQEAASSAATPGAYIVFEQMRTALDRKENPLKESGKEDIGKGWVIKDPFRGDHVCDALFLAIWAIHSEQVPAPTRAVTAPGSAYQEANWGLEYLITTSENYELGVNTPGNQVFQDIFKRERKEPRPLGFSNLGHYSDA